MTPGDIVAYQYFVIIVHRLVIQEVFAAFQQGFIAAVTTRTPLASSTIVVIAELVHEMTIKQTNIDLLPFKVLPK